VGVLVKMQALPAEIEKDGVFGALIVQLGTRASPNKAHNNPFIFK
jgi:hypothetical protein